MSQKQLGNIVLKAINPQETLSAAEKSMLDKFHEELATIMLHFTDSIDNVYNSDVLAAIVTKNAQCTFLINTSNIFNVPIVIDLIAY